MGLVTNPAVDAAAYNSIGAMGVGYPLNQAPVINNNYPMPPETWMPNTYGFKVVKVENGWTIAINGKQWICATPQELGDRMVAILVEERLEK
jgi:hypothetical protein